MSVPGKALLFTISACSFGFAQTMNLVPNGGFERIARCPGSMTERAFEFQVENWKPVGIGTPDYFNSCGNAEGGVPYNWAGVSEAYEGNGYAGLIAWMNTGFENIDSYREYLQCALLQPLVRDSLYIVEFHYKLSSYSPYAIDRIGMLLADTALNISHDDALEVRPTLSVVQDSAFVPETGQWQTARMEWKARGGERYLIIGNFSNKDDTRHYKLRFRPTSQELLAYSAYYYIDDVKVIPRNLANPDLQVQLIPAFAKENIKPDKVLILKNVSFAFNSHKLMPSSFGELNRVVDYLRANQGISIELFGHTDDRGSDAYNQALSLDRAKSVAAYLERQGVGADRIYYTGFGKTKPLILGTAEAARRINRRVELRFVR